MRSQLGNEKAFDQALGTSSTRTTNLETVIVPLFISGLEIKNPDEFRRRLKPQTQKLIPNVRMADPSKRGENTPKPAGRDGPFEVNGLYLAEHEKAQYLPLLRRILFAIMSRRKVENWTKLENPVVICGACGCIHRLIKWQWRDQMRHAAQPNRSPKKQPFPAILDCKMCGTMFGEVGAVEFPLPYLKCLNSECGVFYALSVFGEEGGRCQKAYCAAQNNKACQAIELVAQKNCPPGLRRV